MNGTLRNSTSMPGRTPSARWLLARLAATALAVGVAQATWAQDDQDDDQGDDQGNADDGATGEGMETELEEAQLFFELNNSDNDLGIHGKVDGGPWTRVEIDDAEEGRLLTVGASGPLWRQQVTELFFESEEPPFDELPPDELLMRFPAGMYQIVASGRDVGDLESEVEVGHVMPAAPAPVRVNGVTVVQGGTPVDGNVPEDWPAHCDSPIEEYVEVPRDGSLIVDWDPVDSSHPEIGESGEVEIVDYEVVMEAELEIDPDGEAEEFVGVYSVLLPPDVTEMTVPAEFLDLTEPRDAGGGTPPRSGADFLKVEVLAREATGNRTAVEGCFTLTDDAPAR